MFCIHCGREVNGTPKFCPWCGQETGAGQPVDGGVAQQGLGQDPGADGANQDTADGTGGYTMTGNIERYAPLAAFAPIVMFLLFMIIGLFTFVG